MAYETFDNDENTDRSDEVRRQQQEQAAAQQRALAQQQQAQRQARQTRAIQLISGRAAVIDATLKQAQAAQEVTNDTLSSIILETRAYHGFVPSATLGDTSRTLGRVITGGGFYNGNLVLSSPRVITDPKTGRKFLDKYAPYAVVDQFAQLGALQKSMVAPQVQAEIWQDLVRKGYTPRELNARGLQDPNGLQTVGGTTDGKATSRLFGRTAAPKPHSAVSAFGANGNGGFTNYVSNADTGYNLASADSGTRADKSGRWKVVESGAGYKRYVNDKTGEEYTQKKGDPSPEQITADRNAAMVKGRGSTSKDPSAQLLKAAMDNEAKEKRQQAYIKEKENLRRQNRVIARIKSLDKDIEKELDPKKKEALRQERTKLWNSLEDIPNPDDDDSSKPKTQGSVTQKLEEQHRAGRSQPTSKPATTAKPEEVKNPSAKDEEAAKAATGEQTNGEQRTDGDVQGTTKKAGGNDEKMKAEKARRENNGKQESEREKYVKDIMNRFPILTRQQAERRYDEYLAEKDRSGSFRDWIRKHFGAQNLPGYDGHR